MVDLAGLWVHDAGAGLLAALGAPQIGPSIEVSPGSMGSASWTLRLPGAAG